MAVVLFIAALAFLLASFPARNSDLWLHLAHGRQLAHGDGFFDAYPELAAGNRVQQTWLYDLCCYGVYSAVGGAGLVFFNALVVVGIGLCLLQLSWGGRGWWAPAACTILALVAMGTRLLLQPTTVSYLFLALTLLCLPWREEGSRRREIALLPRWPLLILFVIWANVDRWFVLGLAVTALVELGSALDAAAPPAQRLRILLRGAVSIAVLAAVCLVNPAHVHAFALPAEFAWLRPARPATLGSAPPLSPFQRDFFTVFGFGPVTLTFFTLLMLGLVSFVWNRRRWRWARFLPWLPLALLSGLNVRIIPFFAVAAGPILAVNFQESAARCFQQLRPGSMGQQLLALGRYASVALGVSLLVAAWPGWLQAPPFEPRRWAVETSPVLEKGARAVSRWHQEGKLGPNTLGLHLSPETAWAFAWFCPEDKAILPHAEFAMGNPEWKSAFGATHSASPVCNHLVVYDSDRQRRLAWLERLFADPEQWPLLYLEGDLAIFGRRDQARTASTDPFRGWELDYHQLAFHPIAEKKAPRNGPEHSPEARTWWEAFWKPAPPRPIDRDEAALYLLLAESLRRTAPYRHLAAWEDSQCAALVGAAGGWSAPSCLVDSYVRGVMIRPQIPAQGSAVETLPALDQAVLAGQQLFTLERDDTPPALLFLAIRAVRRALAVNPQDPQAYLILGESYLRLIHDTRERAWGQHVSELVQLRYAQASSALNQAVILKPDLAQAHLNLAALYREIGCLDLALDHQRIYVQLLEKAGPVAGISAGRFYQQLDHYRQELSQLAKIVDDAERAYADKSARYRVLDRAMLAIEIGLAGKARDLLLESDISAFGPRGMELELKLLVKTGRAKDVRDWTSPEHRAALGDVTYFWLRVQVFAALGDYALAQDELNQLAGGGPAQGAPSARQEMAAALGQAVLDGQLGAPTALHMVWSTVRHWDAFNRIARLARAVQQEADATVLRGLLALEQGDVDEADVAFRLALNVWQDESPGQPTGGLDFGARVIAQACLELLK